MSLKLYCVKPKKFELSDLSPCFHIMSDANKDEANVKLSENYLMLSRCHAWMAALLRHEISQMNTIILARVKISG